MSINTLNNWSIKIDKIDNSFPEVYSKLGSLNTILSESNTELNKKYYIDVKKICEQYQSQELEER